MKCLGFLRVQVLMKLNGHIVRWLKNITLMSIRILTLKKSLKKFKKLMTFCQMTIKRLHMIDMVTLHLIKLVDSVEELADSVDSVALKMLT